MRSLLIVSALVVVMLGCQRRHVARSPLPEMAPVSLEPIGRLDFEPISESSGLVKSRLYPDVYWTHNDSGDSARIFAVREDGSVIMNDWTIENHRQNDYEGITIPNAVNVDCEDIAADHKGNLIIGACGNNDNARRDLALYVVPEGWPRSVWKTRARRVIHFHFPDQLQFPPPKEQRNFDCEAVFTAKGHIYLLTKHRGDTMTRLYRLDRDEPNVSNPLTFVQSFDIGDQVTAADATVDGQRLAVLTYSAVWVFDKPPHSDRYFSGKARALPIDAGQCEALCFQNPTTLLLTNEERNIFQLPLSALLPLLPAD